MPYTLNSNVFLRLDSCLWIGLRSARGSMETSFIKSRDHITYAKKNNTAGLLREENGEGKPLFPYIGTDYSDGKH